MTNWWMNVEFCRRNNRLFPGNRNFSMRCRTELTAQVGSSVAATIIVTPCRNGSVFDAGRTSFSRSLSKTTEFRVRCH